MSLRDRAARRFFPRCEAAARAYVVGGAVRDLLLGGDPADVDVACDRSARLRARSSAASHPPRQGGAPQRLAHRPRRARLRLRRAPRPRHRRRSRAPRLHRQRDGRRASTAASCSIRTAAARSRRAPRADGRSRRTSTTTRCACSRRSGIAVTPSLHRRRRDDRGDPPARAAHHRGRRRARRVRAVADLLRERVSQRGRRCCARTGSTCRSSAASSTARSDRGRGAVRGGDGAARRRSARIRRALAVERVADPRRADAAAADRRSRSLVALYDAGERLARSPPLLRAIGERRARDARLHHRSRSSPANEIAALTGLAPGPELGAQARAARGADPRRGEDAGRSGSGSLPRELDVNLARPSVCRIRPRHASAARVLPARRAGEDALRLIDLVSPRSR